MTLMMQIEDSVYGFPYDLITNPIFFNNIQLGETKKMKVVLHNTNRTTTGITIRAIAHPTDQLGPAAQTYDACKFCLTETGTYESVLTVGSLSSSAAIDIYVEWAMPITAIPGWSRFAIQADGVTEI